VRRLRGEGPVVAGVPEYITDLGWWAIFLFLLFVVFFRAQGTYWTGRWVRHGAAKVASQPAEHPRLSRLTAKFSGPGMVRARVFLERWGFIGIPLSFLTVGFQTMVNATAGYTRMRWDLYTLAMLPGCVAWATMYGLLSLSLVEAWRQSPWVFAGVILGLVVVAWIATRLRRSGGSDARTAQLPPTDGGGPPPATARR
jgi:membrane protein DedA with SNARE-associated domain